MRLCYYGSEDVGVGLLGCNGVWTYRQILTFQRHVMFLPSVLKMIISVFGHSFVGLFL
jgi:hypothetical protein